MLLFPARNVSILQLEISVMQSGGDAVDVCSTKIMPIIMQKNDWVGLG